MKNLLHFFLTSGEMRFIFQIEKRYTFSSYLNYMNKLFFLWMKRKAKFSAIFFLTDFGKNKWDKSEREFTKLFVVLIVDWVLSMWLWKCDMRKSNGAFHGDLKTLRVVKRSFLEFFHSKSFQLDFKHREFLFRFTASLK